MPVAGPFSGIPKECRAALRDIVDHWQLAGLGWIDLPPGVRSAALAYLQQHHLIELACSGVAGRDYPIAVMPTGLGVRAAERDPAEDLVDLVEEAGEG